MAHFDIPESPKYSYLDLNDLKGEDDTSTNPDYMRASRMLNIIKQHGVHRVRKNFQTSQTGVDGYDLKYMGKIEEFEGLNSTPYFIKIFEKLGTIDVANDSTIKIIIDSYPSYTNSNETYEEKTYSFTNYGNSGDRAGFYTSVEYGGKTWVFTPIGILSFKCAQDENTIHHESEISGSGGTIYNVEMDDDIFDTFAPAYLKDFDKNHYFSLYFHDSQWTNAYQVAELAEEGIVFIDVYDPINIGEMGITYEGSPVEGDNISVTRRYDEKEYYYHFDVVNVLDDPYIPLITIGSKPDGTGFTKYDSLNLLTDKRKCGFLSDGISLEYILPEKRILSGSVIVQKLTSAGLYEAVPATDYTVDNINGKITFNTAPEISPVPGKDNILIIYEKNPVSNPEENSFSFSTSIIDKYVKANVAVSKNVSSNVLVVNYSISLVRNSSFPSDIQGISSGNVMLKMENIIAASISLTSTQLSQIYSGQTVTISGSSTIDYTTTTNRNWSFSGNMVYTKVTSSTEIISGSVGSNYDLPMANATTNFYTYAGSPAGTKYNPTWIGIKFSAQVIPHVGVKTDGSDSYWSITVTPRFWSSDGGLSVGSRSLDVYANGTKIGSINTGYIGGKGEFPKSGSVTGTLPYNSNLNLADINIVVKINDYYMYWVSRGVTLRFTETSPRKVTLTRITLPTEMTVSGETDISESINGAYAETIEYNPITYENRVPGNARLSCYYGTKYAIVYGHEDDRRIFVSDGTSSDTYSGICLDGKETIYYFPDDNYNVLGEDTEIMGYAQNDGYLYTFKRGDDSVYMRFNTTLNDKTVFPVSVVTKNLQVLASPIQIENEILVLTRRGIEGIVYTANEVRTYLRSYYISRYFPYHVDYDYDKMQWYQEDNLLHILLGKYDFVADLSAKSVVKEGASPTRVSSMSTLQFQYEWYVCELPKMSEWYNPFKTLVLQKRDDENVNKNQTNLFGDPKIIGYCKDRIISYISTSSMSSNIDTVFEFSGGVLHHYPIKARYETPFINFGLINVAKTIRYLYINLQSELYDELYVGYINEEGEDEMIDKNYGEMIANEPMFPLRGGGQNFPKLMQIKNKIKKFMYIKLYIENRAYKENTDEIEESYLGEKYYGGFAFDRILIQYQASGRYRGE